MAYAKTSACKLTHLEILTKMPEKQSQSLKSSNDYLSQTFHLY